MHKEYYIHIWPSATGRKTVALNYHVINNMMKKYSYSTNTGTKSLTLLMQGDNQKLSAASK